MMQVTAASQASRQSATSRSITDSESFQYKGGDGIHLARNVRPPAKVLGRQSQRQQSVGAKDKAFCSPHNIVRGEVFALDARLYDFCEYPHL